MGAWLYVSVCALCCTCGVHVICICVGDCASVYVCIYTYRGQSLMLDFFLSHWIWSWNPPASTSSVVILLHTPQLRFYVDVGNPNLGFYACIADHSATSLTTRNSFVCLTLILCFFETRSCSVDQVASNWGNPSAPVSYMSYKIVIWKGIIQTFKLYINWLWLRATGFEIRLVK